MNIEQFQEFIIELFGNEKLLIDNEEFGFTLEGTNEIHRIGYATNLTPDTVEEAINHKVDLLLTHHDAWQFIHGMKEECLNKLKQHNISHFFIHLPLDDAEFGTNVTLLQKLGLNIVDKMGYYDGFYCGRVGEFNEPVEFDTLVNKLEELLEEPVKHWKNNNRLIQRVGVITGGGNMTDNVKEAVDNNCDVYITGEKVLYTIQYAKFTDINLIVGSHTFTEIFGVESLALKIKEKFSDIEITRLNEEHIE